MSLVSSVVLAALSEVKLLFTWHMTASLLLLNWKRPANLMRILAAEAGCKKVQEILVFNNNDSAPFHYPHPKVKILNASTAFGLRVRWVLAALAEGQCLIFQ